MTKKDFYKKATKDMVITLEEIEMNIEKETLHTRQKKTHKISRIAVAAIAGILMVGTVSVSAYALHQWSSGTTDRFQISSADERKYEETGVVDFPNEKDETKSITKNGITVSVAQTIVDNYFAYVSLKVAGYQVGKGKTPGFDNTDCTLDGKIVSYCSNFYDGTIDNGSGWAVLADGSEIQKNKDGSLISNYEQKDGSLEYHIVFYSNGTKGAFFDKTLQINLCNLGFYEKGGDFKTEKAGTWSFKWKLNGDSVSKTKKVHAPLGNTGTVVSECEVSPISLRAVISMPNKKTKTQPKSEDYPFLSGVKLKDGTLLTCITNGGSEFIKKDGTREFLYYTDRILDVNEIESLLFEKSSWKTGEPCSEENFYKVSITE